MYRARNISLVLCFLSVLFAPTLASLFRLEPFSTINEKRVLAKKPTTVLWSREGLSHAPAIVQDLEKYFGENFGLRKFFIGSYRLLTVHLLKASPNPAVVIGQSDGERRWLFFDASVSNDGIGLESVLGKKPYTSAELAAIAAQLKQLTELVRAKGAKLVIAICPDKQTLYPEYLPSAKRPAHGTLSRLDQFWAMATSLDSVPLVDLRVPLRQAKVDQQLYYPSDTHWNWRAGWVAYQAIARALAIQDPSRGVLPAEKLPWQHKPARVGDLTILMGVPSIGRDHDWVPDFPTLASQAGPKRGKLLAITDSYFVFNQPFFEMQFEKVDRRYVTRGVRDILLTPGLLDTEKPDVVLLQTLERYWTL